MQADDMELVQEFARNNSEQAFATLVQRHINLVYSAALRRLNNPHEAEEVTQVVFIILAKKADSLRAGTVLSGWLYQTAQLTSANFQRATFRRQHREQEAYMQFTRESEPDPSWRQLSPLLEEAMARLGKNERDAIVLRFFENRTIRDVAAALGLQEAATQKRVNRATEKLRQYFLKRGLQVSTATLLASIGSNAVHAAPAGLASAVTSAAAVKTAAISGSTATLIKSTLKVMAWTKAKTAVVTTVIVACAATTAVMVQPHKPSPPNAVQEVVPQDNAGLAFAGYQTPQATLKTMIWALSRGDTNAFLACYTPEARIIFQNQWRGKSLEVLKEEARQQFSRAANLKIRSEEKISDNRIMLTMFIEGENREMKMSLVKIGNDWKMVK
jgi:RNA polymerase sigma factor (sigma-70 family)